LRRNIHQHLRNNGTHCLLLRLSQGQAQVMMKHITIWNLLKLNLPQSSIIIIILKYIITWMMYMKLDNNTELVVKCAKLKQRLDLSMKSSESSSLKLKRKRRKEITSYIKFSNLQGKMMQSVRLETEDLKLEM